MSFCHDRQLTAKKKHRCWYCNKSIHPGERYLYRAGVSDGDFWTMHMHQECDAHAHATWDRDDWEHGPPEEFERPMTAFDPVI
jgi:hypothetical protein